MINIFNEFDLRQEHHQAQLVQYMIAFLVTCLIFLNFFFSTAGLIYSVILLALFVPYFRFYNKALNDLVYTYWGLSFLLGIYLFYNFYCYILNPPHQIIVYINALAAVLLFINAYIMSSPLFYPRVEWWEYDFRYRADFKVVIDFNNESAPARLTDLRRGAGCVVAFKEIPLGSDIKIHTKFSGEDMEIYASISSKKTYIPGRGITYGVRFIINNEQDKKNLESFVKHWRHNSKVKLRSKFKDLT